MNPKKLNDILKKLEGVYKSTTDEKQKIRVKKEINKIKGRIQHIEEFGPEEVLNEDEDIEEFIVKELDTLTSSSSEEETREFNILSKFPVKKIHDESVDPEVNAAITYIQIFEDEFWGALSDFHLKLDYNHGKERDKFYRTLESVKRFINEYIHTLDEFSSAKNKSYVEKLKLMKNKHSRSLIIDSVKFIKGIREFLEKIIQDYENNGNIITNAEEKISFSNIEGKKLLHRWTIINALRYIKEFCDEFIEAIPIPEEMISTGV